MKTPTRHLFRSLLLATLSAATVSRAGLQIPYTPNESTLHLWHFDGALTNANGTTNIVTPDAVAAGGIILTNYGQPFNTLNNLTDPPFAFFTNIFLGQPSAAGLSNALRIIDPTRLTSGNLNALAYGGIYGPPATFANPTSGAFTFEALVNMDANPFLANNSNWEIVSGDGNVNGNANRGWQFRIQSGPSATLNFNAFPGVNAAVNNLTAPLPNSGPNAAAVGQWYHVAVTYTGAAPTNGDTAGVFTFYWTLLDDNRTHADALSEIPVGAGFGFATEGATQLAVGGNGRNFPGTLANSEGFKGYIDEVRMSIVCLKSNEMAFTAGGALNAPTFLTQPASNTVVGFGKPLTIATLVSGTPPISYQWQHEGTNVPGQTNTALQINPAVLASAGTYRLIATNLLGTAISSNAQVVVLASFSELFHTGLDANGALLAGGAGVVDPHYTMPESADTVNLGPGSIVWNMNAAPIAANGGNFENPDGVSQWIGPQANGGTAIGRYIFHTEFILDTGDPSSATLTGLWGVNNTGLDIVLNGNSTGLQNTVPQKPLTAFAITNGFVAGRNTLDFVITNAGATAFTQTGFRAALFGLAQPLPPGKPVILEEPEDQTVRDAIFALGSSASFEVIVTGRPPLSYQWWADGAPLTDATNRALTFLNPFTGGQGTNFSVVISNDSGSVTSQVAVLTLLQTNQPPVAPDYNFTVYTNGSVNVNLSILLNSSSDADHDMIGFSVPAVDATSTNGASIPINGVIATYAPLPDFVGQDAFSYYIQDVAGAVSVGTIHINVVPVQVPTITAIAQADNVVVFSGSGGTPGGSFTVLSSTNVATPLAEWTVISTGAFNGSGQFSVTNAIAPGTPQRFYVLQIP